MQAGPNDLWVFIRPVWVFVLVLLCIFLIAVFAPFVTSHDPNYQNLLARLKPPGYSTGSRFYLLGTDELGPHPASPWGADLHCQLPAVAVAPAALESHERLHLHGVGSEEHKLTVAHDRAPELGDERVGS